MTHSNPPFPGQPAGRNGRSDDHLDVQDIIGNAAGASVNQVEGQGEGQVDDQDNAHDSAARSSRDFAGDSGEPGVLLDGPNVSTLNVLLVGNEAFCKRVIKRLAEAQLVAKTSCVKDYLLALGQASHVAPDVVLGQVDGLSGKGQAISTGLRRLSPGVQLLVVAEQQKTSLAIKAVESGFDDYLLEPVEATALRAILLPESTTRQTASFGRSEQDQSPVSSTVGKRQSSPARTPAEDVVMPNDWTDAWEANVMGDSTNQPASEGNQPTGEATGGHDRPTSGAPASLPSSEATREARQATGVNPAQASVDPSAAAHASSQRTQPRDRSQAGMWAGGAAASSGAAGAGGVADMYGDDPYDTSDAELGDIDLVDCLLTEPGQFKQTVLKLVGGRSGVAELDFSENAADVPQDHSGAWVTYRGRRLGVLHAPPPAVKMQLAPWASWLAHWMAMQQQMTALWNMANKDELTGAWNRRFFDRHLARVIALAAQKRLPVTVLVFDIDNFKTYNDRYGHPAGDEILCETVRLMGSVIREHDVVARIGGDEFAVVFWDPHGPRKPDSSHPDDVRDAARRFQQAICSHHFPKLLEEAPGTLTISGGLASYPWDGVTAQSLVERADTMLLHSKSQGKNAITFGAGAARGGDPFEHES